jgi:hypothetical protein
VRTRTSQPDGIVKNNFFDLNWNEFPFSIHFPRYTGKIDRPKNLPEMLSIASTLGAAFGFIRIDLFSDGNEIFVGEITNCDNNAQSIFSPKSAEQVVSNIIFG